MTSPRRRNFQATLSSTGYSPDKGSNSEGLQLPARGGLPDKPTTGGGSSYVSRTSTESHPGVESALSSHPDSVALVSRNFLVGPPEFDLYGENGSKSVASTSDYPGETEEKAERNDEDIASEPGKLGRIIRSKEINHVPLKRNEMTVYSVS